MALYYDAASILTAESQAGSLKSRIYGSSAARSKPAQIYALISETAKRDTFLKEVIDNAQLLKDEPKLTPLLALLLCHDHFFAKSGIAANAKHPLRQSIEKHKARLQSDFTRARLRRRCGTIEALKTALDHERGVLRRQHPRWARVNTLRAHGDVLAGLKLTKADGIQAVLEKDGRYCPDHHIPHLYAVSPGYDLTRTQAYKNDEIILQDKASCFPAYLLLGDAGEDDIGEVIDGCAAPGNKTTHAAAILAEQGSQGKVVACERDTARSKILQTMTLKAGASRVELLAKQDFLALSPYDSRFANVTHLLLDPSCSGSGILRREDVPKLALPEDPRARNIQTCTVDIAFGKKRKRDEEEAVEEVELPGSADMAEEEEEVPVDATEERLKKLSNLQTRIVEHAMKFPAAKRITYSTCSIHEQENEVVVTRLLASNVALDRGWKVLERESQVAGMKSWQHRGVQREGIDAVSENRLTKHQLDACIRCSPDDGEGTMGFFVCAFYRCGDSESLVYKQDESDRSQTTDTEETDSWEGFD